MKIFAAPDAEDEELDPVDPLGSICIQNDEGRQLLERSVFVDDWLEGLLSGLRRIRSGEVTANVDLHSQRDPLIWQAVDGGALLQHKSQAVGIQNLDAFEKALRQAVIDFTEPYRAHKNWARCTELVAMREWALNQQAG